MSNENREIKFNEQGFLIWDRFVRKRGKKVEAKGSNFSKGKAASCKTTLHKIVGNYEPKNFVSKTINKNSKLTRYKSILDLETQKLTSLVPEIKLYKIKGKAYIPFHFPVAAQNTNISSLLQPGASLGGVGISSFDISFEGKDFFTADKNIICNLSIYTDSLETIFQEPPAGHAPLNQLFTISRERRTPLRSNLTKEVSREQINKPSSHEIGVSIGYSVPPQDGIFTSDERTAIDSTNLNLRLTYTGHNISVSQDGTSRIDIKYIGRLSGFLSDSIYNIIASPSEIINLSDIQKDIDFISSSSRPDSAANRDRMREIEEKMKLEIRQRMSRYLGILKQDNKIFQMVLKQNDKLDYINFVKKRTQEKGDKGKKKNPPPKAAPTKKEKPVESSASSSVVSDTLTKTLTVEQNEQVIEYVFIGDFIQAVLFGVERQQAAAISELKKSSNTSAKNAKKNDELIKIINKASEALSTFKILFGKTTVVTGPGQYTVTNLADIPVSTKVVANFFFENIEQVHSTRMTLDDFLDRAISNLYPHALKNHLFSAASNLPSRTNVKSLSISGETNKSLNKSKTKVNIKELPDFLKKKSINRKKEDDSDYLVIYSDLSAKDPVGYSGNKDEDIKNGVFHFSLSKNRGMVKSIDFSQETVQFRKEALMLESVSLFDELKLPYNANITMFGNGLFLPGSLIYINPSSIGFGDPRNKRSASARLGIGGYYIVISVKTSFSNGSLTTTLSAKHQDWASDSSTLSTAEELQSTGIFAKAKRIVERETGEKSPIQRLY
tara:strand:- start:9493 stop:11832 length:2340 start_codon:yes stop_codon:yes gene_type:complete